MLTTILLALAITLILALYSVIFFKVTTKTAKVVNSVLTTAFTSAACFVATAYFGVVLLNALIALAGAFTFTILATIVVLKLAGKKDKSDVVEPAPDATEPA